MTEITGRTSRGGVKSWLFRASGLARVESVSINHEEFKSEEGDAYAVHGVCRTAAAAAGILLYIKNTSDTKALHLTRLYFDPQTLTDADMLIAQWISPTTVTSGTDITSSGVIQKNSGAINALASTGILVKVSDSSADMTFTGGAKFHEFPIVSRTTQSRDMRGTNILGPGQEWFLSFKLEDGSSAVDDQIIAITVNLYTSEVGRE